MSEPKEINNKRVMYHWPGTVELTIEDIEVSRLSDQDSDTIEKVQKQFIVHAIDLEGREWKAEAPPIIPGWKIHENVS
jgi:hypothetical protein